MNNYTPEKARLEFKELVTDTGKGRVFIVQFNPTELTFSARSRDPKNQSKDSCGISMTMKLIFDRSLELSDQVQEDVEQFLRAASNPHTRRVVFQWNEISFDGLLESVSAVYEMFREDGIPLRAAVDVTLSGRENSLTQQEWSQSYKQLFHMGG